MVSKKTRTLDDPPAASSSDEEDQQEEEEEEEEEEVKEKEKREQSDHYDDEEQQPIKTQQPEPDSEPEPDYPKSPSASNFTIKPNMHANVNVKAEKPSTPVSKRRAESNGRAPKSKKAKIEEEDDDSHVGGRDENGLVKRELEKEDEDEDEEDLGKVYPNLMGAFRGDYGSNDGCFMEEVVKGNLRMAERSVLKEMDRKWQRQNVAEVEVFLGRMDLLAEQTRLVLDAMKSKY